MNQTNVKVAFVIVGWNNKQLLKDCFDSISQQTYKNVEIIYVDNNSNDNSIDWVQQHYPEVTIIAQKSNTGFAKGNNDGIVEALKDSDVKYIGLLNSDARLHSEWTEQIVKFAMLKPKGACFQGTTLDYYKQTIIDSTHIFIAQNGQGTQGGWRHLFINEIGPKKVFGVNAAACLISRDFIESQPFGNEVLDETMFMYLEDVDLAARATIMGWDNYLVRGARAYHMGSASSKNRSFTFSLYMTFRNNTGMLFKNFPMRFLMRMLPRLVRGDFDTIRTLWRTNRRGHILAVLRGRVVGMLRLPHFINNRFKLARARKISDKEYLWLLMRRGN